MDDHLRTVHALAVPQLQEGAAEGVAADRRRVAGPGTLAGGGGHAVRRIAAVARDVTGVAARRPLAQLHERLAQAYDVELLRHDASPRLGVLAANVEAVLRGHRWAHAVAARALLTQIRIFSSIRCMAFS